MRLYSLSQTGVAIIEFALAFSIFWIVFMAILEFCRGMYAWNSAQEATRLAARYASICSESSAQQSIIRNKVKSYISAGGSITVPAGTDWMNFSYYPIGCSTCESVEVKLSNLKINLLVPFYNLEWALPDFKTVVLRESMSNTITYSSGTSEANSICNG
jgi:hypothetical protein